MALDIVGLIGAILLGVGLVMFLIGMIALAGGKRNWQRSVAVAGVGAVIAVVGFLLGGAAFLSSLYAGGATQPTTPGATWNIQFSGTSATPAGTTVVAAGGQSMDTQITDGDDAATMTAVVTVINLNSPAFSGQTFQIVSQIGTFPSVQNPATGASYPLILPDESDPSIADVAWTDGDSNGVQTGAKFYDNVAALGSETYTAVADSNQPAFDAMTVGQTYSVTYLVGPVTLTWNLHYVSAGTD